MSKCQDIVLLCSRGFSLSLFLSIRKHLSRLLFRHDVPTSHGRRQINFESHRGVYAKHMVLPKNVSFWGARSPQCILTRMRLPAARASAKAAASSAHLSSTTASTALMRPLTLAALGVQGLSHTATRALHAAALTLIHRQPYIPETDALAAGTAVFKPRVVRFVVPVVYCHVKGLPPGECIIWHAKVPICVGTEQRPGFSAVSNW